MSILYVMQSLYLVLYLVKAWGCFVTRKHVARIDKMFKKACKWSLILSLLTFDSLLDDRQEKLFNQMSRSDYCLCH